MISGLVISLWILIAALLYRYILRGWSKKSVRQLAIMSHFDVLIKKADYGRELKFYNSVTHVIVSIALLAIGYMISRKYLGTFSAISSSLMCGIIPTLLLKIAQSLKDQRTRKEAINFFATFSNYCDSGFDIFTAFRMSIPELSEPFKSVISRMIKMYDARIDPIICLKTASDELDAMELKSFFKTLIFQYVEGGDIVRLTNDYIKDLGMLIALDEKESAEDQILSLGIYLLVGVQFIILGMFLSSNERDLVVGTLYGEIALTLNFLLSLLMILMTFIKPRRT